MAGFTTVRDVGTFRAFVDVALRDAIDAGWVVGPRMRVAGAYVTQLRRRRRHHRPGPGRRRRRPARPAGRAWPTRSTRCARAVRRVLHGGADLIKVIATGAVMTAGGVPGRAGVQRGRDPRGRRGGGAVRRRRRRARARRRGHQARGAGRRALDRARLADGRRGDRADGRGTARTWSPTSTAATTSPSAAAREGWDAGRPAQERRDHARRSARASRKCVKAGVRIAFGTDSGIYPHGLNARQFAYQVRFGQTPLEAIRSATVDGRRAAAAGRTASAASRRGRYADLDRRRGRPAGRRPPAGGRAGS